MFDWKDNLLVCVGLVLGVALVATLRVPLQLTSGVDDDLVGGLVVTFMLGPSVLRRVVFGVPKLPPPRSSPLASLVSIVGLFATLAGVALLALVALDAPKAFSGPPNFDDAAQARLQQYDSMLAGVPGVTPRTAEEVERTKADLRAEWAAEQVGKQERVVLFGGLGLILAAIGSLAAWWRYPRAGNEATSLLGRGVDGGDD